MINFCNTCKCDEIIPVIPVNVINFCNTCKCDEIIPVIPVNVMNFLFQDLPNPETNCSSSSDMSHLQYSLDGAICVPWNLLIYLIFYLTNWLKFLECVFPTL